MIALIRFLLTILVLPLKSKRRLQAENAILRQQVIVLRRKAKGRPQLTIADRWFFVQLYRWFPSILDALTIIRPETLLRWHRAGFRQYWRWKSRRRAGRPQIQEELRTFNPANERRKPIMGRSAYPWRAAEARFEVSQSTVAKYMVKRRRPPSRDGARFYAIIFPMSLRWISLSFRR